MKRNYVDVDTKVHLGSIFYLHEKKNASKSKNLKLQDTLFHWNVFYEFPQINRCSHSFFNFCSAKTRKVTRLHREERQQY